MGLATPVSNTLTTVLSNRFVKEGMQDVVQEVMKDVFAGHS